MVQGPAGLSRPGAESILTFNLTLDISEDNDPIPADTLGNKEQIRRIRSQSFEQRIKRLSIAKQNIVFDDRGRMSGDIDFNNQQIEVIILFGIKDEASVANITEVAEKFMFLRDQLIGGAIDYHITSMAIKSNVQGRFGGPRPMASSSIKTTHIISFKQNISQEDINRIITRIEAAPKITLVTSESAQTLPNQQGIELNRKTIAAWRNIESYNMVMNFITNYDINSVTLDELQSINNILYDIRSSAEVMNITSEAF